MRKPTEYMRPGPVKYLMLVTFKYRKDAHLCRRRPRRYRMMIVKVGSYDRKNTQLLTCKEKEILAMELIPFSPRCISYEFRKVNMTIGLVLYAFTFLDKYHTYRQPHGPWERGWVGAWH